MHPLHELSAAVRVRRSDMGLTQLKLAALSGLSRATVNQLEKGVIKDLSMGRATRLLDVLGLSMAITLPQARARRSLLKKGSALDIAARSASVSYKTLMSADLLREVLTSDVRLPEFFPHLYALLDEAPVSLLASLVEQVHDETGIERAQVWQRMRELAHSLKSAREIWQ